MDGFIGRRDLFHPGAAAGSKREIECSRRLAAREPPVGARHLDDAAHQAMGDLVDGALLPDAGHPAQLALLWSA